MSIRDDLVELILKARTDFRNHHQFDPAFDPILFEADAILAAGWMRRTWCPDCEANIDTNGGHHYPWCKQVEAE